MANDTNSAQAFLDTAYRDLDFTGGDLIDAVEHPSGKMLTEWVDNGEWLFLAKKVGAEKVLFVNNNPVIVFAKRDTDDAEALRQTFNNTWCMARPALLFLAKPGELAVYDLTQPPAKTIDEWNQLRPIDVVRNVAAVAEELKAYRREQVESGRLFEEKRFGDSNRRADQSLIRDLKTVRAKLRKNGLDGSKLKYAHALIGRSIFIRYLEDRKILTKTYFEKVASEKAKWQQLLEKKPTKPNINPNMEELLFPRILEDKDFTYAFFDRLSKDFNGDMFPSDLAEEETVTQSHLKLLQQFLRGDMDSQEKLFFFAYKFDIVPIELISCIYEEFYNAEKGKSENKGCFYTPSSLVEFLLSQVLTPDQLDTNPRILDPACGSGIFIVQAFRRIVRYRVQKQNGRRLSAQQLRKILCEQIAGIDINEEAIRIAAFSLYLSLLHYQEPPDILAQIERGHCLPNLVYVKASPSDEQHFNNLLSANAFPDESQEPDEVLQQRFGSKSADIVVANPPWGAPNQKDPDDVSATKRAIEWCVTRGWSVGYKERSQAFIVRTLDLLKDGGWAALLISTGVFFKHQAKSRQFREKWLMSCKLTEVVNFAHVRDIFFTDAIAPFAAVVFENKTHEKEGSLVHYWTAKKTASMQSLQAVVLSGPDLKLVQQHNLMRNDKLWKIYWWGGHHDEALIDALELYTVLGKLSDEKGKIRVTAGRGFTETKLESKKKPAEWLSNYKELPTKYLTRYGPINFNNLRHVPQKVKDKGIREVYEGDRLLVKRGPSERCKPKGQLVARFVSESFSVRHSVYGIKLSNAQEWEYKVLSGIFLSSLARYYFFLTTSTWGMWHHEIHLEELLKIPVRFPESAKLRDRIIDIVDKFERWAPTRCGLKDMEGLTSTQIAMYESRMQQDLDDAIFDLYELSEPERDLICDMCNVGLDFFYNKTKSNAVKPIGSDGPSARYGLANDIPTRPDHQKGLEGYLHEFLQIWNRELEPDGQFRWQVIRPGENPPMIAVVFSTQYNSDPLLPVDQLDDVEWSKLLSKLEQDSLVPYASKRIFIDGLIRVATDTDIVIIKRNEQRFWTRSLAREDADATLLQAINLQEAKRGN